MLTFKYIETLEAQLKYTIRRRIAYEEVRNCISPIMSEQEHVCACACMEKRKIWNIKHIFLCTSSFLT